MYQPFSHDTDRYISYYTAQAGGDLSGFSGSASQYGSGIGGIFRGLFRTVFPLIKKGFAIAKPHLKTAGKNIISDVIAKAVNSDRQEGSGMVALSRRAIKRPPGQRRGASVKAKRVRRQTTRHKKQRTKTAKRRLPRKRRSTHRRASHKDIF